MSEIELVIFDCDGVLVDSEVLGVRIEVDLLSAAGCEISVAELTERFSGMSWSDILLILEKERGGGLMDILRDKAESELDARLANEVEAIDGVRALLEALPYKMCVCSNTKMPRLEAMLSHVGLKGFFGSSIFSAKELGEGRSKPKPDIFLYGAERMGAAPAQTIVVEDSVHGVQAACSAGMRVIGFIGGSHSYSSHASKLSEAGASVIVRHMRDIPAAIAKLASSIST